MTNRKFRGLSLDCIFKIAVFATIKQSAITVTVILSVYHFLCKTLGKNGPHWWKLSTTRFVFFSIEPVLSLPLLMIALLPVTPQYICKAIHLQLLVLNTTQVFSIVSGEGQLIVHLVAQYTYHCCCYAFSMTNSILTTEHTALMSGKSANH